MKRMTVLLAILLAVAIALGGCNGSATDTSEDVTATAGTAESAPAALEGYETMPADGVNESAALAAVADAFSAARTSGDWPDADWTALEAAGPRFVAYLVRVDLGEQVALFEVRSDGIAHNIYGYQRAFDSGSIIWTPVANAQSSWVEPVSAGETSAANAVATVMLDAFPNDQIKVSIHGYRFVYVADGAQPMTFEIAPDGTLISVGM